MNKLIAKIKFIGAFLVIAAMCIPAMNVQAAVDTYTVTFRPGNVGYFAITADAEGDRQAMAAEVAAQVYGGYGAESVTITKNGAIKVTVSAGQAVPNAPAYIQAEAGYFVKDTSVWGPASRNITTVDKNMDFVVDYGKLVDGVEYTVEYVDSESGESIAPVYIAQANIGDSREVTAPKQIVISEATVYNLTSAESVELVLDADSTKNVFTFEYTMAPRGVVEEEIVNYVDGGTVTTTETFTTFVDNGTIVTTTPAQGGGAGGNAEDENESGTVVIEDENVPLAPSVDEDANGGNLVSIGDEDVPLANFADGEGTNTVAIIAGIFVLAAIAVLIIWLRSKKKKSDEDNIQETEKE